MIPWSIPQKIVPTVSYAFFTACLPKRLSLHFSIAGNSFTANCSLFCFQSSTMGNQVMSAILNPWSVIHPLDSVFQDAEDAGALPNGRSVALVAWRRCFPVKVLAQILPKGSRLQKQPTHNLSLEILVRTISAPRASVLHNVIFGNDRKQNRPLTQKYSNRHPQDQGPSHSAVSSTAQDSSAHSYFSTFNGASSDPTSKMTYSYGKANFIKGNRYFNRIRRPDVYP
jgi:hypothetical protein